MWPTFYIPSSGVLGTRPRVVSYVCSTTNYGANCTTTVPIPDGTTVGNLMIAYVCGNNPGNGTTFSIPTGWKQMQSCAQNYAGGIMGPMAWKFYENTDSAGATFSFNNTDNLQQKVCIVSYSGVDADAPFGEWRMMDNDVPSTYMQTQPQIYPTDSKPAVIGITSGTSNLATPFDGVSAIDNGDINSEFSLSATGGSYWGSSTHGLYHVLYHPTNSYELENLIPYSAGNLGSLVTTLNATLTDTYSVSYPEYGYVSRITGTSTVGSARKCLYFDINLTAGETYSFEANLWHSGGAGNYMYMTVDDGTTETGSFFESNTPGYSVRNSVGSPLYKWSAGIAGSGTNLGAYCGFAFTAAVTGSHRFYIGLSTNNGTPEMVGNPFASVAIRWMELRRGVYHNEWHNTVSCTTGSTTTGVRGLYSRLITKVPYSNGNQMAIELCRSGATPAPIRMHEPDGARGFKDRTDYLGNYEAGNGYTFQINHTYITPMWFAGKPAYPNSWFTSAPSKQYMEFTMKRIVNHADTCGVGWMDSRYQPRNAGWVGNSVGDYWYAADGKIRENGSVVGTYATYTTNDIIGIGIDWGASTLSFYKNGTLIKACTFTGSYPRWPFVALPSNNDGSGNSYIANLTGPFTYLPSGYSAFDWQNAA